MRVFVDKVNRRLAIMVRASIFGLLFLAACATEPLPPAPAPGPLPIAHSNNAVALAEARGQATLYSFNGLRSGKTHADVSKQVFACQIASTLCVRLPDVPVWDGRLASSAVTVGNTVYLFGGYTVAEDGSEVSSPEVHSFEPAKDRFRALAEMPVPVDDAVLFTHLERYIYLVSGWHDTDNVSLVQVYDVETDTWARATNYPGSPVFGHAGGAAGGEIVIADGVAVLGIENGQRKYGEVGEVWHGRISPDNHLIIDWSPLPAHPYGPLYRMAATGSEARRQIVFAGGGDNPYNITGIGYDGIVSIPSDKVFAYDLRKDEWVTLGTLAEPSMDHRGLIEHEERFFIVGGLSNRRRVRDGITVFTPEDRR